MPQITLAVSQNVLMNHINEHLYVFKVSAISTHTISDGRAPG